MERQMSRPIYETAKDRANEAAVAARLSKAWGCKLVKCAELYMVDWVIEKKGKVTHLIEIRCRKNSSTKYPTLICSMQKIIKGINASEITGLPFVFVPSFTDKLMWIKPTRDMEHNITMAGSDRRNDPADMEPCYNFKISDLTEVIEK
tara:strand:- start:1501 stop:1944 length:444 start_codon:yes stop_codon:yes gene_type:complete